MAATPIPLIFFWNSPCIDHFCSEYKQKDSYYIREPQSNMEAGPANMIQGPATDEWTGQTVYNPEQCTAGHSHDLLILSSLTCVTPSFTYYVTARLWMNYCVYNHHVYCNQLLYLDMPVFRSKVLDERDDYTFYQTLGQIKTALLLLLQLSTQNFSYPNTIQNSENKAVWTTYIHSHALPGSINFENPLPKITLYQHIHLINHSLPIFTTWAHHDISLVPSLSCAI